MASNLPRRIVARGGAINRGAVPRLPKPSNPSTPSSGSGSGSGSTTGSTSGSTSGIKVGSRKHKLHKHKNRIGNSGGGGGGGGTPLADNDIRRIPFYGMAMTLYDWATGGGGGGGGPEPGGGDDDDIPDPILDSECLRKAYLAYAQEWAWKRASDVTGKDTPTMPGEGYCDTFGVALAQFEMENGESDPSGIDGFRDRVARFKASVGPDAANTYLKNENASGEPT